MHAAVALGIAVACWARLYLGPLWSGRITRKLDHRVVDSGPYALMRHPICSGLLLSLLATAAAKGTVLGAGGFVLLCLGLWAKARQEDRWLSRRGRKLCHYRERVPMLLPFAPTGR